MERLLCSVAGTNFPKLRSDAQRKVSPSMLTSSRVTDPGRRRAIRRACLPAGPERTHANCTEMHGMVADQSSIGEANRVGGRRTLGPDFRAGLP